MVDQGCNAAHQHSSKAEQRPSKADESSRLRNFRRDLIRAFFFLASNLFRLIAPAHALPTPTVTTTASSTSAAPSATASAGADRDSSFQVFADGTQDIAALVGIFATDSVEKYAIDYNKGYLATAVANLSLLGLLGYARLLVKLALGAEGCRKAGFDMKPLRPMFGVQDEDHIPTDAVHEVFYVQRKNSEGQVHWRIVKMVKHTKESFQLLKVNPLPSQVENLDIVSVWLTDPPHVLLLPLLSFLCSALTCFSIMIFERPLRQHQPWTYYYATVGLFCSIMISSMTWTLVHIREQHPRRSSDWAFPELSGQAIREEQMLPETSSLDLKDTFAFSRAGTVFHIYDVSDAERKFSFALKISSFSLSGSILIGYACQYIEVRRLSPIKSGYWLLIQGALAAIRVVLWVWDPSWDDSQTNYGRQRWLYRDYDLTETRLVVLWASLRTHTPAWWPDPQYSPWTDQLDIPKWALPALSPRNQNSEQMFELARRLSGDTIEWDDSLQILQNAENFWDMPPGLFMAWVFAWPNSNSSWVDSDQKLVSCIIIKDNQCENGVQRFHFLPCWYRGFGYGIPEGDISIRGFNVPSDRNRCVFALDRALDDYTYSGGPRQRNLTVGYDTPIRGQNSMTLASHILGSEIEEIFEAMNMMWKALDPILNRYSRTGG